MAYAIAKLCLPERIEDATSILAILAGLASLCVILFCLRQFTGLSVLEFNELSTGLMIIEVNAIAWATCVSFPSAIASGLSDAVKICVEKWRGLFIPLSILGMILTTGLLYRIESFYFDDVRLDGFHPVFAAHALKAGIKWMCICLCYFNRRACPSHGPLCVCYFCVLCVLSWPAERTKDLDKQKTGSDPIGLSRV
jgi:hypothetical protein